MVAFPRDPISVPILVQIGLVSLLLGLAPGLARAGQAVPEAAQAPGSRATGPNSEEPATRPSLRFGDPTRPRAREATIPIHFAPRREQPVGSVWADITIPSGPWRFQRADAPPRSGWRVSATRKRQTARASPSTAAPTELELTVTAGRRAIPEGLLGYLRFRLDAADSPLPSGLSVTKIETAVPDPDAAQTPTSFPPLFSDPTLTPGVACFFFTH